jgi:hypothetical protein
VTRIVVIGDVGGHPDQLRWALSHVGAYGDVPVLPDDLVVVQVGDLVDRGPDSMAVLDLVGQIMHNQPGQWVQLIGNHEWQYLPEGSVFWADPLPAAGVRVLSSWWDDGRMGVAAAVATSDGQEWLLSHAGLTLAAWQDLGEPMTAGSAAWALNDRPPLVFRSVHTAVDRGAGPLWAEAGWELYQPWLEYGGLVPFGQIHGHSAIVRYADRTWRAPGRVLQRATVDWVARQTRVRIGGRLFIGTDPKHGTTGAPMWEPLILEDATIVSPALTLRAG